MLVLDCLGAVFGARLALFFAGLQEDDSDAARRSPCEGGLAIHTGLLDLSLSHDQGMYPTTIGAHHHRSESGEQRIQFPDCVRSIPAPTQKHARQAAGQISNRS